MEIRKNNAGNGRFRRLLEAHRPLVEQIESRILLSTYTVNTVSDAANPGTGLTSLRQAIASANAHAGADTINFAPSVFTSGALHTILLLNGKQLSFTDTSGATTLSGPGAGVVAVDGHASSRVFNISKNVTVTISGLTITNGFAGNDGTSPSPQGGGASLGGGISNAGTLTLNGVTVTKNTADGTDLSNSQLSGYASGGGIYSTGTLTLQNSTVSFNKAHGADNVQHVAPYAGNAAGGGIYGFGSLTITSSTISSNEASGGQSHIRAAGYAVGGGIYDVGTLSITSSKIANNTATGGQGFTSQITSYDVAPSAFGGGVFCNGGSIVSSQITGNVALGGDGKAAGVTPGTGGGGGIYSDRALTITSSTVSANTAQGANGVGVAGAGKGGGIFCEGSKLVLNQSTVSGNVARGNGAFPSAGGNGSDALGGGIYEGIISFPGSLIATASSITGNQAIGGAGNDGTRIPSVTAGTGGHASGGGIWLAGPATLTDCTIANNQSQGGLGGQAFQITGNATAGTGGDADGGGIFTLGMLQLFDSTIATNSVTAGAGALSSFPLLSGKPGVASAGGIDIAGGSLTTSNSIISGNLIATAGVVGSTFSDIVGAAQPASAFNLIGVGGGLVTGTNGNKVGITDPKLMPLGNYGGPTQTMLPMPGSPAIDAGSSTLIPTGLTVDQRGMPRIYSLLPSRLKRASVDIGADEYISLTLRGTVYNDINGDGIRQAGEPGTANWKIYIDLNNSGAFVASDPSAITDANGNYTLSYIPTTPQSLLVREVRQTGLRRTQPAAPSPLGYYSVSPTAGAVANLNFGNSATALISGTVFNDANGNGVFDASEHGVAGFRVFVDLNHDGTFETSEPSALSDVSGNWSIAGLAAGSYVVRIALSLFEKATTPPGGALSITLSAGQFVSGKLFGEVTIQ
ncbi:MAG TPA: choice-of-anchor Q domain-containing protein [Humisphaera sp.]|jgi:hypothetical protein|nr:choice-of-anchor Q domain-containing protein [Humisphaera sp.]